jgi:hypothetical protein
MEYKEYKSKHFYVWHDPRFVNNENGEQVERKADEKFSGTEDQLRAEMAGRVTPYCCNEFVPSAEEVAEGVRRAKAKCMPDDTPVTMKTLRDLGFIG